ncbi:TPA: hypothetical protein ACH3X1_002654 [Trebouxia sp. C0004]
MSRSDANSAGSMSKSVGAPGESRVWDLFTSVTDGSGQLIQKHNRKLRSCSACLEDGEYYSLDKAINTLRVVSQHKSSMNTCHSFWMRANTQRPDNLWSPAGALVTDNGGGCEKARRLVTEKHPQLIKHRCMMNGFALTMGSVFDFKWAAAILRACKRLVRTITMSHNLTFWLREEIKSLKKIPAYKHLTWLIQAATTRFTTLYNCMRSVLDRKTALENVVRSHKAKLTKTDASAQKALVKQVENYKFWAQLARLTPLAEPFNKVCPVATFCA